MAYDGSKNAERALSRATSLAKEHGASLIIVAVVNTTLPVFSPYSPTLPQDAYDEMTQSAQDTLGKAVETAKRVVGEVKGVLEDGEAADKILRVAAEQNADLVVVGRRGLTSVERFLLGGVSSAVVGNSTCDVLVVK